MPDNMRRVEVKVTTRDGKDNDAVPTYIEVNRGAGEIRTSGRDLVCNKDVGTFELRPGERLVIEGYTAEAIAYDREQAAAFQPGAQRNTEGKIDSPSTKAEPGAKAGALPTESQDSRVKSSPGSTVSPEMAAATQREQENQRLADEAKAKQGGVQPPGAKPIQPAPTTTTAPKPPTGPNPPVKP